MSEADQKVVSIVMSAIRTKEIDVSQVLGVVTYTMTLVEKLKGQTPGAEKAEVVVSIVKAVLNTPENGIPEDVAISLRLAVEYEPMIYGIMTGIVDAAKGRLKLNAGVGGCMACLVSKR